MEKNRTEHSQAVGQYEMSNICVTGIPKEERKHKMWEIFEQIMANFSKSNERHQIKYTKSSKDTRDKNKNKQTETT